MQFDYLLHTLELEQINEQLQFNQAHQIMATQKQLELLQLQDSEDGSDEDMCDATYIIKKASHQILQLEVQKMETEKDLLHHKATLDLSLQCLVRTKNKIVAHQ
jgi:hypothetical protein